MRLRHSLWRAAGALLLLAGAAGFAHAEGTFAGTDIKNNANLKYSVGGTAQNDICSSPSGNNTATCTDTTFKVDNKINLLVTTSDTTAVSAVPGGTHTLTFVVSNTGNNTQDYVLSAGMTVASNDTVTLSGGGGTTYTDSFDVSGCTAYDTTGTAIAGNRLSNVAPDDFRTIKLACVIPSDKSTNVPLTNSDVAIVSLTAVTYGAGGGAVSTQSATNSANTVDTVFADVAGTDGDTARNGQHAARSAYKIQTAALTVSKTFVTLCDPVNGAALAGPPTSYNPKSIPGAYIRYTIQIANSGSAPASAILTSLKDTLDTKVTFDSEYITGANNGVTGAPGCAATTATTNPGTATSTGNAVLLTLTGGTARTSFPGGIKYLTQAAAYSSGALNINWTTALPATDGASFLAGELQPGQTISVTYNVIIN